MIRVESPCRARRSRAHDRASHITLARGERPPATTLLDPVDATPDTPFTDLDDYLALRRLGGLALSPDGIRLVTTVADADT